MTKATKVDVTIAINTAISSAALIGDSFLVGLVLPAAWTAAGIAFHVSYDDGTTYVQLSAPDRTASPPFGLDEVEVLAADVPTAESVVIALDPSWFFGATHVKVRSQTAGTPVNQTTARTVGLMFNAMQ